MKEIIVKLSGGYAWKFYNLPDRVGGYNLSDEYKNLMQSDYNIGFDKNNRKTFLERLEYLTRKDQKIKLKFPLDELAVNTPYHLDDRKDYIKYPKRKFKNLIIEKIEFGKEIEERGDDLTLRFGNLEVYELFTRMYVNFEIYATWEDNVINMIDCETGRNVRLVIWGVYNGNPIHY